MGPKPTFLLLVSFPWFLEMRLIFSCPLRNPEMYFFLLGEMYVAAHILSLFN